MDFSQKLPFCLGLQSIKACYSDAHGLYFEITYTHLIADAHVRMQILSDAKCRPTILWFDMRSSFCSRELAEKTSKGEKVGSPVMSYRGRSYILSLVYIKHYPKYILA
ncbi:unnamed protein product [Musa banksii]